VKTLDKVVEKMSEGGMEAQPGVLYVVATPIGNLEDMTFRAIAVLRQVDVIAAEDTRHTGKLLHHFQIDTPQLSYHDHNRLSRLPEMLQRLQDGQKIALVTDAGMPGISDPGYEMVKACSEAGFAVVPIPGASAVITALSAAGLPTDRFVFEGFLPLKGQERRDRLEAIQTEERTLVFYEAPHRVRTTLEDLAAALGGDRAVVLGRELTKLHEQFWRGTLAAAIVYYQGREPQGEFTLVVAGATLEQPLLSEADLKGELKAIMERGVSRSQASRQLAQQTPFSRRHLYQLALTIPDDAVPEPENEM
jgi:16S rRNA (cytidine1402-2'-O)-methyltransferase